MTREIKFRAWNPIEEKLEYWTLNDLCYHSPDRPDICLQKWQQFTGLLDKNGKEIYEGDVFRFGDFTDEVVFDAGYFQGKNIVVNGMDKVEIIGNIYEHSHLLSESKESK